MRATEHILLQEIREQPKSILETVREEEQEVEQLSTRLRGLQWRFLGMGSSYFASIYAKYLFQELCGLEAEEWLSSEFIHYPSPIGSNKVLVAISQSGESAETIKAVRFLKKRHHAVVGITNEPDSSLAELSDLLLLTHAGVERASATKTFVATLALLHSLAVSIAVRNGLVSERKKALLSTRLLQVAHMTEEKQSEWEDDASFWGRQLVRSSSAMILGRGYNLAGTLQGALLLKEVAKMPAEGMTSGEFTHGPLEMVSRELFILALGGDRASSLMNRLAIRAKHIGARVLLLTSSRVSDVDSILFPATDEALTVFPCVTLIELLAYFTALEKHLNPDRFRFISKVTRNE